MKKLKQYKKVIIAVLCIIIFFIILVTINDGNDESDEVPYPNIEYGIAKGSYCSCITFNPDNTFGEYDCDSEPSDMPYSGEYYDNYSYDSNTKIITFKPNKGSIFKLKRVKAKVLEWTKDKLVIKVLNPGIFSYSNAKKCAINGKNIYEYEFESSEEIQKLWLPEDDDPEYKWDLEIHNDNFIKIIDSDTSVGYYEFIGLKEGTTTIIAKYININDNSIKKTKRYEAKFEDYELTINEIN